MTFVPREPFELRFGRFEGKSLEQLIWEPGFVIKEKRARNFFRRYVSGYAYNDWLIRNITDQQLMRHALAVKHAADTKIPSVKCQLCGKHPAVFVEIGSNESGVTIGPNPVYLFCGPCSKHADKKVALEFARIGDFTSKVGRCWFIRTLKLVFYGNEKVRITSKVAFDFLFQPPQLELF